VEPHFNSAEGGNVVSTDEKGKRYPFYSFEREAMPRIKGSRKERIIGCMDAQEGRAERKSFMRYEKPTYPRGGGGAIGRSKGIKAEREK